jgi:hypothetical protein
MQTSVEKLANSFRDWQRDWDRYDKEPTNKPKSFDEFIQPFVEMHKQEIINAHLLGLIRSLDMEATKQANEYYQETFKKDYLCKHQ